MKLRKSRAILALTQALLLSASVAFANPSGGISTYGNAVITQPNSSTVQVNIPGQKAIINWNSFSVGSGESTNFIFANQSGGNFSNAVLNRVTGNSPSSILGSVTSNGALFLVNPNGIVFGSTAVVNTPALFATTLNLTDAQFKAFTPTQSSADHWAMSFNQVQGTAGSIEMQAGAKILTSGQDGVIAIMAKSINIAQGVTLSAPKGTVMLAAAKKVDLSQSGAGDYGMFNMAYNTENGNNINNQGDISILDESGQGGGSAIMIGNNITQAGKIHAVTSTDKVSRILLVATNDVNITAGSITDASGGGGNRAGYVGIVAGGTATINEDATIKANGVGNNGGDVIIKANHLDIASGAVINTSVSSGSTGKPGIIQKTVNGGGDVYATVEYARLAVRPNGDKMVLVNDGVENLPPVLPAAVKRQAEKMLSTSTAPTPIIDAAKPAMIQNEPKPALTTSPAASKPSNSESNSQAAKTTASSDAKSSQSVEVKDKEKDQ